MTVKELKEKLNEFPEHMDIYIDERLTDFRYGCLNGIAIRDINFMEDPEGEPMAKSAVVILTEE